MEAHCPGQDYRIYVLNNRVIGAWQRTPGGITGDGIHTVDELLAEINAEPRRQPEAGRLYRIAMDEEAEELLREYGHQRNSVIEAGKFVPLRRTCNVLTGGLPVQVPLTDFHQDNLALCSRAASLLHLDLAGIDLLSEDIGRSWLEGGTNICEINAQPQMPPALQGEILSTLVFGSGRIPVIMVVDNREHIDWLDKVMAQQQAQDRRTGLATASKAMLDNETLVRMDMDAPHSLRLLLRDPRTDIAFMVINSSLMLANGLPVDRCDLLILSGITGIRGNLTLMAEALASRSAQVWVDSDSPLWKKLTLQSGEITKIPEKKLGTRLWHWLESAF